EDDRLRVAPLAVGDVQVRVAHAARLQADEELAVARRIEEQRLDAKGRPGLVEHGGPHRPRAGAGRHRWTSATSSYQRARVPTRARSFHLPLFDASSMRDLRRPNRSPTVADVSGGSASYRPTASWSFSRLSWVVYQNPQSFDMIDATYASSMCSRSPAPRSWSATRTTVSMRSFSVISWICSFDSNRSVTQIVGSSS